MSATSYNNDRPPSTEIDYATDPASGSFFTSEYKKHEDLKQLLDSNKDGMKLAAMKRIIGMIAKGRDASDLFPAVVKNVVSSNLEVKKLVYVYLVRYAEEQQDLALLSISTFQRALKDPNQLIRACALRVLSSIRVPVIVPIMMLAIKEGVTDMSPYVRKTAAHAIPKLYDLDPEQKEELMTVIEKLLSDKTTLVVGSAVMAFEEVCPERIDLVHKNYRKLCNLLVDVEEWGQVIIINMLTRYARTQFLDPNAGMIVEEKTDRPFYDDEVEEEEENTGPAPPTMDPDHRLLLRNTKPLLQSRNAAVVLAVGQLYQHVAPVEEITQVARALVRLLRGHREVQAVVLTNIASMSTRRKGMFEPYLKSFFVRSSDPTHIKSLKLEVLTNLATDSSISIILREFQTYIGSHDKEFVAATIQAIGRCAANIKEVTDTCLAGLVTLLSNRDESIVGESVVVVRKLLQSETVGHKDIITNMAKLIDNIKIATAKTSILFLLGEYCDKVPKIAPDVLRKMAKNFIYEEDIVKLQVLTLATKLYLTNPKQTRLLCQYVYNLAKYDTNYDVRDRARFLRAVIFPPSGQEGNKLSKQAKNLFLAAKPPPVQQSSFKDRDQFQLGTLSHFINARATGYQDLPPFPEVAPDPTVRNVELPPMWTEVTEKKSSKSKPSKKKSFYSDEESSEEESESGSSSASSDESSDSEDSDSESSSEESSEEEFFSNKKVEVQKKKGEVSSSSDEEKSKSSSYSSSAESTSSSDEESEEEVVIPKVKEKGKSKASDRSNLDLLLELDDVQSSIVTPVLTPSLGGLLTPMEATEKPTPGSSIQIASAIFIPTSTTEVLNRLNGNGLSICARFNRSPHLYSSSMTSVELTFENHGTDNINNIRVGKKQLVSGMAIHDFAEILALTPSSKAHRTIGIDFNDTTHAANFDIQTDEQSFTLNISPSIGELLQPVNMNYSDFLMSQEKLKGMNEHSDSFKLSSRFGSNDSIIEMIYQSANVIHIKGDSDDTCIRLSGQTMSKKSLVLITVKIKEDNSKSQITVNCDKMIIASMILKCLISGLSN